MTKLTFFFVVTLLLVSTFTGTGIAQPVSTQPPQVAQDDAGAWLQGVWEGTSRRESGSVDGARTMRITKVAPDGAVQGTIGAHGRKLGEAQITRDGSQVNVTTRTNGKFSLIRTEDGRLAGSMQSADGILTSIEFVKVRVSAISSEKLKPLILAAGLIPYSKPEAAEDFAYPEVRTGEKLSLVNDFAGKVVLINTWATWCPPCVRELPDLQKLHSNFAGKGLIVLGVDYEASNLQKSYLESRGATYPCVSGSIEKLSFWIRRWYPQSFLIDRSRRVVAYKQGVPNWNTPEVYNLIQVLLSQDN